MGLVNSAATAITSVESRVFLAFLDARLARLLLSAMFAFLGILGTFCFSVSRVRKSVALAIIISVIVALLGIRSEITFVVHLGVELVT
jgi:hypothetical protein